MEQELMTQVVHSIPQSSLRCYLAEQINSEAKLAADTPLASLLKR